MNAKDANKRVSGVSGRAPDAAEVDVCEASHFRFRGSRGDIGCGDLHMEFYEEQNWQLTSAGWRPGAGYVSFQRLLWMEAGESQSYFVLESRMQILY
jgi:hypothetical protein